MTKKKKKMLTEKEQDGVRDILAKLGSEDLYSLTSTVTKGYIKPENKYEAVQAILLYCEKPSLLLRRKKIKKEIIFNYLRDKGIVVAVSGEKSDYVKACLQFWGSREKNQTFGFMDEYEENSAPSCEGNYNVMDEAIAELPTINPFQVYCNLDPKEVVRMGQEFVSCYYGHLNKCFSNGEIDKTLFANDCSMSWLVKDAERVYSGTVNSASEVMQVTTEIIVSNILLLHPGLEGVLSSYDQHGIVQVKVGGVIHRMNISIGLFEQAFGLIRDPTFVNCWKIKRTDMKMQVNISLSQPLRVEYL